MRRILGARPGYGSSSTARAAWLLPVLVLHIGLLWWLLRPAQRLTPSATSTSVWLQLVPWSPSLEKQLGRHVSGVARADGGIDWGFGRNRGLGL